MQQSGWLALSRHIDWAALSTQRFNCIRDILLAAIRSGRGSFAWSFATHWLSGLDIIDRYLIIQTVRFDVSNSSYILTSCASFFRCTFGALYWFSFIFLSFWFVVLLKNDFLIRARTTFAAIHRNLFCNVHLSLNLFQLAHVQNASLIHKSRKKLYLTTPSLTLVFLLAHWTFHNFVVSELGARAEDVCSANYFASDVMFHFLVVLSFNHFQPPCLLFSS